MAYLRQMGQDIRQVVLQSYCQLRLHSMTISQGDIFHFRIYSQHTIILNSVEDVRELFEKRAGLYSDRPKDAMVNL